MKPYPNCHSFRAAGAALVRSTLALTLGLALSVAALAADALKKSFDVPAGEAIATLKQFMEQADARLLYSVDAVRAVKTHAVKGELSPREALEQMLDGTGLAVTANAKDGTLAVSRALDPNVNRAVAETAKSDRPEKKSDLTETETGEKVVKLDTFEVFGRKTLNMDIQRTRDDIQPYIIFDKESISRSGASTLDEFFRDRLTAAPLLELNSQTRTNQLIVGTSTIDIRGLGASQTLILVNGRRTVGRPGEQAISQPDLNAIPLGAIERIEVLSSTASGIYGGSATAGVINIVLKHGYKGGVISYKYDQPIKGGGESESFDFNVGASLNLDHTTISIYGTYSNTKPILVRDRDFLAQGRQMVVANNPSAIFGNSTPPLGTTTNIRSNNGAPLVLKSQYGGISLGSPITYIPSGYAGITLDGAMPLVGNAGYYNLGMANTAQAGGGGLETLRSGAVRKSASMTVTHQASKRLEMYVTLATSENDTRVTQNLLNQSFTIPQSANNNPFAQDIRITTPALGGEAEQRFTLKEMKGSVGAIVQLPAEWQLSADIALGKATARGTLPMPGIASGGSSLIASGVLDVLRDTNTYPVSFENLRAPDLKILPNSSALREYSIRAGGPIWHLSGGQVTVSASLSRSEYQQTDIIRDQQNGTITVTPRRSQVANSIYAETQIPMWCNSDDSKNPYVAIQLAARLDSYTSTGANNNILITNGVASAPLLTKVNRVRSANPTIGVKVNPAKYVILRGSYSTGFIPPALNQLVPSDPIQSPIGLLDPRRGMEPVGFVPINRGGNPNLKPETSKSISAGLILSPKMISGLRLSVDWTRIRKTDNIGIISTSVTQSLLADEALYPNLVQRGPAAPNDMYGVGPVTAFNLLFVNIARGEVEAIDYAMSLTQETRMGQVNLVLNATQTLHHTVQALSSSPNVERVGTTALRRWNAFAEVTFARGKWQLGWSTKFIDDAWLTSTHALDPNTLSAVSKGGLVHDCFVAMKTQVSPGFLKGAEFRVGVSNIASKKPNKTGSGRYVDPIFDLRLTRVWVGLKSEF